MRSSALASLQACTLALQAPEVEAEAGAEASASAPAYCLKLYAPCSLSLGLFSVRKKEKSPMQQNRIGPI